MSDNLFATQEDSTAQQPATQQASPQGGEQSAQTAPITDPYADLLKNIVTEDGRQKYADVNTALNSISHAQMHISELTRKNAELQEEVAKRAGMEQVLERINSTTQTNTETPSVNSLSEAQVRDLLDNALKEKDATSVKQSNEMAVTNQLVERYGDKETALTKLKEKATELGVNIGFLQSMAQNAPKAVLSYFTDKPVNPANSTTPGVNTTTLYNQRVEPDKLAEARAKLFGQSDPLVDRWKAAAKQN